MDNNEKKRLKRKIDRATVVSFDIFDTLLFRKTNTPEAIFDLVGKHFGIHGFRKLRMDEQNEASRRAYEQHGYPHADMDQIYEVLAEHTEIEVDWTAVKEYEIEMERAALVANTEMLEIFRYAKEQHKRVVATSDMYLFAETLAGFLEDKGFIGLDYLYCSADEHKAKFNRDLFELVAQKENVPYENILHIGDKKRDDGEYPSSYGMDTFVYIRDVDLEKGKHAQGSDVDAGLYKILYDREKGFWYNLGVEVGGPLYMGLYRFLKEKYINKGKKLYFLSRDGYNLYHLLKELGVENIEYLYTSRRALTMASIKEMNEEEIDMLPPYTYGQTVGEILDYLCVDRKQILHLQKAGFQSFDDLIYDDDDREAFKQIYHYNKEVFLERCKQERENALQYFNQIGFFAEDVICFDCGWQGSSQILIERFKNAIGAQSKQFFVYFGIKDGKKSRMQLNGLHYDTYLFDFYKRQFLQEDLNENVVLYELFFSAPQESVYLYGKNGSIIFEDGNGEEKKEELLNGIRDFFKLGLDFIETYDVEYSPDVAVSRLKRLIHCPTEEEAKIIGDIKNVDGFGRKEGEEKYVGYLTQDQLDNNPEMEIYWFNGLMKRPDVSESVKKECARRRGVRYPQRQSEYHLEGDTELRTYQRWRDHYEPETEDEECLAYRPKFSIVIPVYNTSTEQLKACFDSVLAQNYKNYELILVNDFSTWENVIPVLHEYEQYSQVRVIFRASNGHISRATNDGIQQAEGEFIVFMDCDDVIEPNSLYEFAKMLNENPELDFIYSDEDKLTEDGKIYHFPFFKPDWSPDLFMNMMYTNHLATYRTSLVKKVGGLRTAYNGSQDYDFTLRFMEQTSHERVGHVAKVLYHWRERKESVAYAITSKNYAAEAARNAKEDYIRRNCIKAHLELISGMSQYRIVYEVVGEPLVSIIIPSKDHPEVLKRCIDSIRNFTNYKNYEIIVIDNGSTEENRKEIEAYLTDQHATYLYEKNPFNFSKMCNDGVKCSKGQFLLFLNDDIEVFQPEWLERMLGHAQQKHVGAVGAKLYYPKTAKIQHVGVSNPADGPLHSFMGCDDGVPYYFGWNRVDYNCIAVTGACLLVDAEKFKEVNGFDEAYPVAYNDVKLCFALHRKGYYHVVRNDVVAYHYESLSRGSDQIDDTKLMRLHKEKANLFADFEELNGRDPFMNENLRQFAKELDLKCGYDRLQEMDVRGSEIYQDGHVEHIIVEDRVQVLGWSIVEDEKHIEELERYLIVKDPYGRTYGAKARPYARADVAEALGDEVYEYAGFECVLSKQELRVDLMPYQTGVLTIDRNGKRYLSWCKKTSIIKNQKPRPIELPMQRTQVFEQRDDATDIKWHLDECKKYDKYYRIRGYAFKFGCNHQLYKKSIVLIGREGDVQEVEVQLEERLDVAYSYPKEHFLYYTGFVSYLYLPSLKNGQEYEVAIRLRNALHAEDVYDIRTDERIGGI